jgi:hypothetical protein
MTNLTPGHLYVAANFEDPSKGQLIQFIEKRPNADDGTKLDTINDGTTNEEVLAVLIDRLNFLQAKFPCRENAIVITKLQEALMWLNERTKGRVARNVEGKQIA